MNGLTERSHSSGHLLLEATALVERLRLELVPNLQEGGFRDRAVFRPHVDRVAARVAESVGEVDRRTEQMDCLGTSEHEAYAKPI